MIEEVLCAIAEAERLVMVSISLACTLAEIRPASIKRKRLTRGDIGTKRGCDLHIALGKRHRIRPKPARKICVMRRVRHSERPVENIAPFAIGFSINLLPIIIGLSCNHRKGEIHQSAKNDRPQYFISHNFSSVYCFTASTSKSTVTTPSKRQSHSPCGNVSLIWNE